MKKICCVNDMPGVGKVGLSAMLPILSAKGVNVTCLPTALTSNTIELGKCNILDTTDYMAATVETWNELGLTFDCIATGFMVNPGQADVVEKLIASQQNPLVVVDPVMGDEGQLYRCLSETSISTMRRMAAFADVFIPNITEACLLAGVSYESNGFTEQQVHDLLAFCRELGAKSVVITSILMDGVSCAVGYDHRTGETFAIRYGRLDAHFPGTGDVFSATLAGDILNGMSLKSATENAMRTVSAIILDSLYKEEKHFGVDVERFIAEGKL